MKIRIAVGGCSEEDEIQRFGPTGPGVEKQNFWPAMRKIFFKILWSNTQKKKIGSFHQSQNNHSFDKANPFDHRRKMNVPQYGMPVAPMPSPAVANEKTCCKACMLCCCCFPFFCSAHRFYLFDKPDYLRCLLCNYFMVGWCCDGCSMQDLVNQANSAQRAKALEANMASTQQVMMMNSMQTQQMAMQQQQQLALQQTQPQPQGQYVMQQPQPVYSVAGRSAAPQQGRMV